MATVVFTLSVVFKVFFKLLKHHLRAFDRKKRIEAVTRQPKRTEAAEVQATELNQESCIQQAIRMHKTTRLERAPHTLQATRVYQTPLRLRVCLKVRFLNGTDWQHELVRSVVEKHIHALEITIRFEFMNRDYQGPSTIRISFVNWGCSWSQVGLWESHRKADDAPTMALKFKSDRNRNQTVILHEFGHALGLEHQHQHPDSGISWNANQLSLRLDKKTIQNNFTNKIEGLRSMPYDRDSVMHYPVKTHETWNLTAPIPMSYVYSIGDKKQLLARYPPTPALTVGPGLVIDLQVGPLPRSPVASCRVRPGTAPPRGKSRHAQLHRIRAVLRRTSDVIPKGCTWNLPRRPTLVGAVTAEANGCVDVNNEKSSVEG